MAASPTQTSLAASPNADNSRLDYLDATRAFALLLGIVFHASLSFMPVYIGWAVQDVSTSPLLAMFMVVSHSFRMEAFFLLAGFFSHLTLHRKGGRAFIDSRLLRIVLPFVVGWLILRPLLVSGWVMGSASLRGDVDVWAGLQEGFRSLATLPAGIFVGTHLWFLYYVALITALFLTTRGLLLLTGPLCVTLMKWADARVAWLANAPLAPVVLAVPTAGALWFMRSWGMDTPDQSLAPHLPVLAIYSGFFGFGWLLCRQRELISRLARLTPSRWILAGLGIAAILLLGDIELDPSYPHFLAAHATYALGYALTMWSLVLLTIGVFRKLCSRPNAVVRYIADSAYWMYLVHLPLVVWLQVAVAELPLHWSLKLAGISALTIVISLLTYDLFVRSTIIGRVLHGRRHERVMASWLLGGSRCLRLGNHSCSSGSSNRQ